MKIFFALALIFSAQISWARDTSRAQKISKCVGVFSYLEATNTPKLAADAEVRVRPNRYGAIITVVEKAGQQIRIQYLNEHGKLYDMLILDEDGNAQYVKPSSHINKSLNVDKLARGEWAAFYIERFKQQLSDIDSAIASEAAFNVWSPVKTYYPELFRR